MLPWPGTALAGAGEAARAGEVTADPGPDRDAARAAGFDAGLPIPGLPSPGNGHDPPAAAASLPDLLAADVLLDLPVNASLPALAAADALPDLLVLLALAAAALSAGTACSSASAASFGRSSHRSRLLPGSLRARLTLAAWPASVSLRAFVQPSRWRPKSRRTLGESSSNSASVRTVSPHGLTPVVGKGDRAEEADAAAGDTFLGCATADSDTGDTMEWPVKGCCPACAGVEAASGTRGYRRGCSVGEGARVFVGVDVAA